MEVGGQWSKKKRAVNGCEAGAGSCAVGRSCCHWECDSLAINYSVTTLLSVLSMPIPLAPSAVIVVIATAAA